MRTGVCVGGGAADLMGRGELMGRSRRGEADGFGHLGTPHIGGRGYKYR